MKPSTRPAVLFGILLGALLLILARFFFAQGAIATHHHANFAVFINGDRLDLTADKYMEDVEGCKPDFVPLQPRERVHMHSNEDVVAHVHDEGVTWGHFFANIGFSLSDSALQTDEGIIYSAQGNKKLSFIVNGEEVSSISNDLLVSEDKVLISYGSESLELRLENQYSQVEENAKWHNEHPDPGSCSGEIKAGFWDELKKAIL
jgi:hypothetical protein